MTSSPSEDWINGVNTTSLRIVVSLVLATVYVIVVLAGGLLGRVVPREVQDSLGWFIIGMMGVDAAVFTAKRFSDVGYATAKTPNPAPVTVEAPSTVRVSGATPVTTNAPNAS